jgi:hypothetical protein
MRLESSQLRQLRSGRPLIVGQAAKRLTALIVVTLSICISSVVSAAQTGGPATRAERFDFEIAAQPLGPALLAFGSVTGIEIIYDSALTYPHQSSGLKGRFTADEALLLILAASGLATRAVAPGAITIVGPSELSSTAFASQPDSSRHAAFFAELQESFARAFCHPSAGATSKERLLVRFRIAASGAVDRLEMLGFSEEPSRHGMVEALKRVTFDVPPPKDLPQPIMMLILPQTAEAC